MDRLLKAAHALFISCPSKHFPCANWIKNLEVQEIKPYTFNTRIQPSSYLPGRDGTRRKDRREAMGRSDGVHYVHQKREQNRTTVQIGKRREELNQFNFSSRKRA